MSTFIKQISTSRKILEIIKEQGGLSAMECKKLGIKQTWEGALLSLYKRDYIKRFPFSTLEGYIYYIGSNDGFKYGLKKGLIPISVKILFKKIKDNGAVTSLELKDEGLSQQDIDWFYRKLVITKMLKSAYFRQYFVFYDNEDSYKIYLEKYHNRLDELANRYIRKIKRHGSELEKLIGDYYEKLGFSVERNKFFTTTFGEKLEIDILATKQELGLTLAVECKNYEATVLGPSILLKVAKIKELMPRALIHIYAKHISNSIMRSRSFWHQYRDVWIFSSKRINEIYETVRPHRGA